MRLSIAKKVAMVATAMTMAAGTAQAFIFAAPILGAVVVGGIVATVAANKKKADKGESNPTYAAQDQARLISVVNKIDGTAYSFRMIKYARYSNGYHDVISRYNKGRITGNMSLESLAKNAPKLFADLDILEQLMTEAYSVNVTTKVYGSKLNANGSVNWLRYKLLAQDALAINEGQFNN